MTTRAEHLAWCKQRALAYVDRGELDNAFASFASDLNKSDETSRAALLMVNLGMPLLVAGQLSTSQEMRRFIEGFN